ncbi:putative integral membrane protein [Actinacidiphila reveromycinica]|uniref:Putative integral membrane protein n=1 Tax=Actinacidiphila reveromycinica TaxID=659352 RepID=A0A7U3VPD2_9ACTN|nr:FUSC family protein [Streptomyces sp. SN-593]BBA98585.1 putative integral membrane protein [Streptomyces sp. SN-593]
MSKTVLPPHGPRRLPTAGVLRLGRTSDIWFKPAVSAVVASAVPNVILLCLDRLDLAVYTMAGSLCATYAHNRPYANRARTMVGVIIGMVAGLATALVTSSLVDGTMALITVGALLAAVQKLLCDATRIGPPAHVIFTFISSAALFVPQRIGQVPGHLALTLGAAALAYLVSMAPGLFRPQGPERRAVRGALRATARYAGLPAGDPETGPARDAAAAAIQIGWQNLLLSGRRTEDRRALERLLIRAEIVLASPTAPDAGLLAGWADRLRGTGPVPRPADPGGDTDLLGVEVEHAFPGPSLLRRMRPGGLLLPVAVRTFAGCALAGYVSFGLGVGRPYWAIVTAAAVSQANVSQSWRRSIQRVVGNVVGVLVFVAVTPLTDTGSTALVLVALAFNFAAEAFMPRNYWLGSICVTPMALLIVEFARPQSAGVLLTDRVVDTLVGAVVGMLAAMAVVTRRPGRILAVALSGARAAQQDARRVLADPQPDPARLEAARRRLTFALVELREVRDIAAGEWWQAPLPEQDVLAVQRGGHRTLAETVRAQGLGNGGTAADTGGGAAA